MGEATKFKIWTTRRILFAISAVVTILIMADFFWTANSYKKMFNETARDNLEATTQGLIDDRLDRQYWTFIKSQASEWSRLGARVKAMRGGSAKEIELQTSALKDEAIFNNTGMGYVNSVMYDKEMNILAHSSAGQQETVTSQKGVLENLKARDIKAQRQPVGYLWRTDAGKPVHSIIVPIGGFRVLGFLEVVTDPIYMLAGVSKLIHGDFQLEDINKRILISEIELSQTKESSAQAVKNEATNENELGQTPNELGQPIDLLGQGNKDLLVTNFEILDDFNQVWTVATVTNDIKMLNDKIFKQQRSSLMTIAAVLGGSLLIGAFLLQLVIFRPMRDFSEAMDQISKGNTDVRIPVTGKDELSVMATALHGLRQGSIKLKEIQEQVKIENEKRQAEMQARLSDMSARLDAELRDTVATIQGNMQELEEISDQMAHAAHETEEKSRIVAQNAEDATDTARAVEGESLHISASFGEVSGLSERSTQMVQQARADAKNATEAVSLLASEAEKISEVIDLINDIANQTNMLALNATIEAARAGESGKGFVVVATEVKNLASRTADATQAIASQITAIQKQTDVAVAGIHTITSTITQVDEMSTSITDTVHSRRAGAEGITVNIQQAANATQGVQGEISVITGQAMQVGKLAQKVRHDATAVAQDIDQLKTRLAGIIQ